MRKATSAVQIFDKRDEYVDEIDMNEKGNLVIVPWNKEWTFWYWRVPCRPCESEDKQEEEDINPTFNYINCWRVKNCIDVGLEHENVMKGSWPSLKSCGPCALCCFA